MKEETRMFRRTLVFLAPADVFRPAPFGGCAGRLQQNQPRQDHRWRRLTALVPLALLSACTTGPLASLGFGGGPQGQSTAGQAGGIQPGPDGNTPPPTTLKVGILLPLTGGNASLGQAMLKSAQLALDAPGAPPLDPQDTGDAPGGAARAAQAAIGAGDGIIIGPLTSLNTAEAAPLTRAASVPMLAFTSDLAQAQPGVWVMGVTPEQQVHRLVDAAKAEGRTRIAALLPNSAFGNAMADALEKACNDAGLPAPMLSRHLDSMESINSTMRTLTDFTNRRGAIEQQVKDAKASDDPAVRAQAATLAQAPIPPAPFDALLLADTGTALQEVITVLKYYDVSPSQVRIMGPGLWGAFAGKLGSLEGAWFAAPDAQDRLGFTQRYQAKFGQLPKPLADIPYDAAALARNLSGTGGYRIDALTRADGFAGVDGLFALMPDGHVRRGLAIFQIQPGGGARIVQPAPKSLASGTS